MRQKIMAGTWQTQGRYLVWKIDGKMAKLKMMTFAYRSTSSSLYEASLPEGGGCGGSMQQEGRGTATKTKNCFEPLDIWSISVQMPKQF